MNKGNNGVWDLKKNFALLELLERLEEAAKEKENIFTSTFLERERELVSQSFNYEIHYLAAITQISN